MLGITAVWGATENSSQEYTLTIDNSLVNLRADEAPLPEILNKIASDFGFSLRGAELATELISCRLIASPLSASLESLLVNWNYVLLYKKNDKGESAPSTLWVINKNPHRNPSQNQENPHLSQTSPSTLSPLEEESPSPEDHLKKFKKNEIAAALADSEDVLLDIDTTPCPDNEAGKGIKITRLYRDSPLKQIGLLEGDVILDVNGLAVNSAAELVKMLTTAIDGPVSVVRIERYRNGLIDPIYLELQ